jgi:hypothetical protein
MPDRQKKAMQQELPAASPSAFYALRYTFFFIFTMVTAMAANESTMTSSHLLRPCFRLLSIHKKPLRCRQ